LETERKTFGAIPLRVDYVLFGKAKTIYPVMLVDGESRILVDCGYPGFLPKLERASADAGIPFAELTGVVITHCHYDHCGSLPDIKGKYPKALIMASAPDALALGGEEKPDLARQSQALYEASPEFKKARSNQPRPKLTVIKPVPVDIILKGGDVMPWRGGTEIIATPGHTPGHISLFVRGENAIIAGDALVIVGGRLRAANPRYSLDPKEAKASAEKLMNMRADTYICYHGGASPPRLS
jgi:glyoxylase-like metal-dependent hydrolase (beta-lactamase superfamily II)